MNITAKELLESADEFKKNVDDQYAADEKYFHLENTVLKENLTASVNLHMRWIRLKAEVKIALKGAEMQKNIYFAKSLKKVKMDSHIDYGASESKTIAEDDEEYTDFLVAYNRILVVYDEVNGVLEGIDARRWTLKNIVDLVVADGQGVIL